jgi:hypothetical protein
VQARSSKARLSADKLRLQVRFAVAPPACYHDRDRWPALSLPAGPSARAPVGSAAELQVLSPSMQHSALSNIARHPTERSIRLSVQISIRDSSAPAFGPHRRLTAAWRQSEARQREGDGDLAGQLERERVEKEELRLRVDALQVPCPLPHARPHSACAGVLPPERRRGGGPAGPRPHSGPDT